MQRTLFLLLLLFTPSPLINKDPIRKDVSLQEAEQIIFDGMRTFAKIFQISTEKHYRLTDLEDCINEAMKKYLNHLDPHSSFLDEKTYKKMLESTSGEFYGIGIIIDNTRTDQDKTLLVIDTIADGPAYKAGMQPLDKIVEINEKSLEGMTTDEAIAEIKGERNSIVHLKVMREGKPDLMTFDITRDVVKEQNSLCFYLKNENSYYISLTMFSENAMNCLENLLAKAEKKPYKALILDLRNNTGGLLNSAVDIAGLFLKKGSLVVSTRNNKGEILENYTTTRNPLTKNTIPIFILINNYTASAAEILAGCLKLHSEKSDTKNPLHVFLVGTKSFGKGSVQEVIPITSTSAAKITTSFYFLPQDISIQAQGITPDFIIEKTSPPTEQAKWFQKYYGRESVLPRCIKNKGDEEKTEEKKSSSDTEKKSWSQRAQETLKLDNQFLQTITLSNLYHFIQEHLPKKIESRNEMVTLLNSIMSTNKPLELVEIK